MVNPTYSGEFSGFKIEIMDSDSSVILEEFEISDGVKIEPGNLTARVDQENCFRSSRNKYTFFINLANPVFRSGQLFIQFNGSWSFQRSNCSVISGVNAIDVYTEPTCYLTANTTFVLENFEYIDSFRQIILAIDVVSPYNFGYYDIDVYSYNVSQRA